MPYIFSTMSQPVRYTRYEKAGDGVTPIAVGHVLVNGFANVANKALVTLAGSVTLVTDEELKQLQQDVIFNVHLKNGFLKIENDSKHIDANNSAHIERGIEGLEPKDESAPLTPADYGNNVVGGEDDPKLVTIDLKKARKGNK